MSNLPVHHEPSYQAGDRLPLQAAAELFAARDKRPHEQKRQAVDRWRKRIQAADQKHLLPSRSQTYEITDLVSWALSLKVRDTLDWPERLAGLPRKPFQDIASDTATAADTVIGVVLPGDLKRCHAEIRRLANEVSTLHQELSQLHCEANILRAKANRYDQICERNRASGSMPKKP